MGIAPRAIWHAHHPQSGQWFGWTVLAAAFSPWWDKHGSGGALDVRRFFMTKDGYRGTRIYYPSGTSTVQQPNGSIKQIPNQEIAMQIVETIRTGGVFALPSEVDANGTPRWKVEESQVSNNPSHILQYPKELDAEILNAMGIADDVLKSEATGSWAGKAVPQQATYCILEQWLSDLICDVDRVIERLVEINFGPGHQYEITTRPLADQMLAQQNGVSSPTADTNAPPKGHPSHAGRGPQSGDMLRMGRNDYSPWLRMAWDPNQPRAPKGGVKIRDVFYPGGEFIPVEDFKQASDQERRIFDEKWRAQDGESGGGKAQKIPTDHAKDGSPSGTTDEKQAGKVALPETPPVAVKPPMLDPFAPFGDRADEEAYNLRYFAYMQSLRQGGSLSSEEIEKQDAAFEALLEANPDWLQAFVKEYGDKGLDQLKQIYNWGYSVDDTYHWFNRWHVDPGDRSLDVDRDPFGSWVPWNWFSDASPQTIAQRVKEALDSGQMKPPRTDNLLILQPGDIGTWDGGANQHVALEKAQGQTVAVLRETRNNIVIEIATLGVPGVAKFALDKVNDAAALAQQIRFFEQALEKARAVKAPAAAKLERFLEQLRRLESTLVSRGDDLADKVIGKLDDAPSGPVNRAPSGSQEKSLKGAGPNTKAADKNADPANKDRNWIFRGDDKYKGGPVGLPFGPEADAAEIQSFLDHVLNKESRHTSRYRSFTLDTRVARKFPEATDNRYISRAKMARLRELEAQGQIKIWTPDDVYEALQKGPKKFRKKASEVRARMRANEEILIEGQIPAGVLEETH